LAQRVVSSVGIAESPAHRARACFELALNRGRLGDATAAVEYYAQAAALYASGGNPYSEAQAREGVGLANLYLGNLPAAIAEMQAAQSLLRRLRNGLMLAKNLNNVGLTHHALGEYGAAHRVFREALDLA